MHEENQRNLRRRRGRRQIEKPFDRSPVACPVDDARLYGPPIRSSGRRRVEPLSRVAERLGEVDRHRLVGVRAAVHPASSSLVRGEEPDDAGSQRDRNRTRSADAESGVAAPRPVRDGDEHRVVALRDGRANDCAGEVSREIRQRAARDRERHQIAVPWRRIGGGLGGEEQPRVARRPRDTANGRWRARDPVRRRGMIDVDDPERIARTEVVAVVHHVRHDRQAIRLVRPLRLGDVRRDGDGRECRRPKIEHVYTSAVGILIDDVRVGLVVLLLCLAGRFGIAHEDRRAAAVGRDRVARDVGVHRRRRRRRSVDGVRRRCDVDRRCDLDDVRLRFASGHRQSKKLCVIAARRGEVHGASVRRPLTLTLATAGARRELARRLRLHVGDPQMGHPGVDRRLGHGEQDGASVGRQARICQRASVAQILVRREMRRLCRDCAADGEHDGENTEGQ